MKKFFIILIGVLLMGCTSPDSDKMKVAVSIVPQRTFVEAVAGDLVEVVVMIPPGYSPANYQPSPKEIASLEESQVYFYLDVQAEQNIMEAIQSDTLKLVDLAETVDAQYPARFFEEDQDHEDDGDEDHDSEDEHDHDHSGRDPHIWLSPKRVMVMVEMIRDELMLMDPDNAQVYQENAKEFLADLQALDQEFQGIFQETQAKTFLIYHPSYGYFAEDYGLNMVAIEDEGKEATIQGMEAIIELAKSKNIHVIFYQEEFDSQQAEIIAKEIQGVTVEISPLSGDYLSSMRHMASELKNILD